AAGGASWGSGRHPDRLYQQIFTDQRLLPARRFPQQFDRDSGHLGQTYTLPAEIVPACPGNLPRFEDTTGIGRHDEEAGAQGAAGATCNGAETAPTLG